MLEQHEVIVSGIELGNIIIFTEIIKRTSIILRSLLSLFFQEVQLLRSHLPYYANSMSGIVKNR